MTTRRIRTILHADQPIRPTELDLLHTPSLQRLYDMKQLGLTDRVFIDASHSRIQHVLGVMNQIDRLMDTIADNLENRRQRILEYRDTDGSVKRIQSDEFANYVRQRKRVARYMAMLHDLTHAPFGHTLEDEIELEHQKHDDPDRQSEAYYRLLCEYFGWLAIDDGIISLFNLSSHLTTRQDQDQEAILSAFLESPELVDIPDRADFLEFISEKSFGFLRNQTVARLMSRAPSPDDIAEMLVDLRFAMRALLWLDLLHKDDIKELVNREGEDKKIKDDGDYAFERLIDLILAKASWPPLSSNERFHLQRDAFLLDAIGNTICADLLDYAKRDCHFAGLKLDYDVERITENFTIVSYGKPKNPKDDLLSEYRKLTPMLRTAISIFSHKLRVDMPGELMNLLQVRFYVYQRVLFHPTKCVAGAMLGAALQFVGWRNIPRHFRYVGDAVFLEQVAQSARFCRNLIAEYLHDETNPQPARFWRKVNRILDQVPETGVVRAIRELIETRQGHRLEDVQQDLEAALGLLDRLAARRYHRSIFRLLPNAEIPSLNLDAVEIASFFRNAAQRARVERQIEARASLPKGSVAIHCPNADGPRKIAEILILSEKGDSVRIRPLRELSKINPEIFESHQDAIIAVEKMYKSMWRLQVSVASPYHANHATINNRISRVLYAALSREEYENIYGDRTEEELDGDKRLPRVPNDPLMKTELSPKDRLGEVEQPPNVTLIYRDGHREKRRETFFEVSDIAVRLLGPEIQSYIQYGKLAATGREEVTVEELLCKRIKEGESTDDEESSPAQQSTLFDNEKNGGESQDKDDKNDKNTRPDDINK